jgi:4-diphosphocytidyl-2-C-methyl-D-erythritol kinase
MAATARAFVLNARAKFNLRLEVGYPESGGLHSVRSIIADLLVSDEVAFLPSERGFTVTCDDPSIPERANLARRAADALGLALPDVRIHVRKAIPVQAGLGGGSADADAALRGLAALLEETGITLSADALMSLGASIGSDVPACLVPGLKLVEGTGEIVRPIAMPAPHWGVLLLKPAIGIAAADAYSLLDRSRGAAPHAANHQPSDCVEQLRDALVNGDFGRVCALAHNDFQSAIEDDYPAVMEARLRLVHAGAAATILCGSGSCVAGLFKNVAEDEKALTLVQTAPAEWAAATGFADAR